ncbi:MAG: hypothetical protein IJQ31_14890 [Thermoguttaceae bacterium]|nr:hypothetical protein [Thermoguttaceae bacterium]
MIIPECGCIPNEQTPEVLKEIAASAVPWDRDLDTMPNIIDWTSFEPELHEKLDSPEYVPQSFLWWDNAQDLFTPSQEYRPNCAGFAMANASLMRLIIQSRFQYSEQKCEKFNPMLTWLISKGGSAYGGQSIAAIAKYGNQVGNFLAKDVGDYDPAHIGTARSEEANRNAARHQIGFSLYDGDDPGGAIIDLLKCGYTCFVGNDLAVSAGTYTDENGVDCVQLSGSRWSHATAFGGAVYYMGKWYFPWGNSHGPIYKRRKIGDPMIDNLPDFCGLMPEETVRDFMSGSFHDLCAVLFTEAPYDPSIRATLNPSAAKEA